MNTIALMNSRSNPFLKTTSTEQ